MNSIFSCPLCHASLEVIIDKLVCSNHHIYPIIDDIIYFLPIHKETSFNSEEIKSLENSINYKRYVDYINLKRSRNIYEAYSIFQPFNESFQSLLGFIEVLKNKLKPGDLILDTWCRTGFSGDFLAGIFPEQIVVSIWEGNNSVLGYQGFHHFFQPSLKHDNHHIVFHDCNKSLPFKNDTFDFIYAYDSLHRYKDFDRECLRVGKTNSIINFAHVHLSNSQPDPYFKRDGLQRAGNEYQKRFNKQLMNSQRDAYICSETEIYANTENKELISSPNNPHYNGFIWIADNINSQINSWIPKINKNDTIIINPLLTWSSKEGLTINDQLPYTEHLLSRHPVIRKQYNQHFENQKRLNLEALFSKPIHLAQELLEKYYSEDLLLELSKNKVIFPAPLSAAMIRAQAMHINFDYLSYSLNMVDLTMSDQRRSHHE